MKRGFRWPGKRPDFVVRASRGGNRQTEIPDEDGQSCHAGRGRRTANGCHRTCARIGPRSPEARPSGSIGKPQSENRKRIAAASDELASGITQSASAAEELRRAMEQIATGAEEAAAASQETLAAANTTAATLAQARDRAVTARGRTDALQKLIADSSNEISAWANNIRTNGERQAASVAVMEKLSEQAASIGDVTKSDRPCFGSDQPPGLERRHRGARAGDQGRGFAVVADEVAGSGRRHRRKAPAMRKVSLSNPGPKSRASPCRSERRGRRFG